MIVRISGEGQFRLPDEDADRLNELDNEAVAAVEAGDEDEVPASSSTRCSRWWRTTARRSTTTSSSSPT